MPIKIEIFVKSESDKTPTLLLNTRISGGVFEVFACDRAGQPLDYSILWQLRPNGTQRCVGSISGAHGLALDDAGRIRGV